ncbi:ABC transporter substrate-binding protein [Ornithinimicrobium sp. Arc0846-15]|nr:ABC transporter substrate-binding protein [Ornithinimicrobium laminariae]
MTSLRRSAAGLGSAVAASLVLAACSAPANEAVQDDSADQPWEDVVEQAQGQEVSLWMWGGDPQGNAYVDDVLIPAAAEEGVTLRRVPVASTQDALTRVLSERQAGTEDGDVDLVWVNGDNFSAGQQAGAWLCGWTDQLPNMAFTDPDDELLTNDFGNVVDGCEAPWHKAQFAFVYDEERVPNPPTSLEGILEWTSENPGRFTYPAPPDFTGSVFLRQALYSSAGGAEEVPLEFDQGSYDDLSPALFERLQEVEPDLWREGETYPRDSVALDQLFIDGEVDFTMTYGPATLTQLVENGTFPQTTQVLQLDEGTVGNASFLAMPSSSGQQAGAKVVANLALSPEQQALKADPGVWGQFTVLDADLLDDEGAALFEAIPDSPVVPPYAELSEGADPELSAQWVPALDEGWRTNVLVE